MLNRKNATLQAEVVSYNKKKEVVTVSLKRLDNSEFIEEMVMTVNTFKTMFPELISPTFSVNTNILPEKYGLINDEADYNEQSVSWVLNYQLTDNETIPYNEIQNLTRILVNQFKESVIKQQKFAEVKSNMDVCYFEGNLFTTIEIN